MLRPVILLLGLAAAPALAQNVTLDPPPGPVPAEDAADLYDTETIVVLAADAAAADRLIAAAGRYVLLSRDALEALGEVMVVFRIPDGVTGPQAIAELEAMEPDVTAGVNHAYRPGPEAALPQGRVYAGALLGWPDEGCMARVPVGIVDTGLAPELADLAGARIERAAFATGAADTDHGSAVAELIAGRGRLSGATIYHAAVVGPVAGKAPAAGVDALVRAVDWLRGNDVRLANVSLAGPYNKILDRALQAAAARGMVIVAAAGNTGRGAAPRYPAAFRQTIAVTAVDAALHPYELAADGAHIDVAAPGVDVFVPLDGGTYLSGTSIAAPFVTAIIAADPVASAASAGDVRDWLASGARDLGDPGTDTVFGAGLVQTSSGCAPGAR